jgi:hypothetical protein
MWTGGALAKSDLSGIHLVHLVYLVHSVHSVHLRVPDPRPTSSIPHSYFGYWLFARSALSYPYPPACTKHEWNIKNHAKLASVRIASRPSSKFLSSVSP